MERMFQNQLKHGTKLDLQAKFWRHIFEDVMCKPLGMQNNIRIHGVIRVLSLFYYWGSPGRNLNEYVGHLLYIILRSVQYSKKKKTHERRKMLIGT